MVKIGAIDYYDKIIAGMNYELTMQDNGTPAAASYPIAKVVGQCDATTMLQVEWWHTLNSADIRIIKAINSTDNYMGLYNTDASTNFKAGWYIIQVTFDPDPATCNASPATFKTPLKAKYIHAGDNLASINADVDSGVGYGGFKFFSKMNAFVVAGTLN